MPEGSRFACRSCGKEYRWKPELAGKRAKCKCGGTVEVPTTDPAAAHAPAAPAEESFDDVFALAAAEAEQAAANQDAAPHVTPPPPQAAAPRSRPAGPATVAGVPVPRRAKVDNTPSSIDRWQSIWRGLGYTIVGLLVCAYAAYEFHTLTQLEEHGGRYRMRIWVRLLYMVGGKWGVLIVLGGVGLLAVLVGVLAVFGKVHIEGEE